MSKTESFRGEKCFEEVYYDVQGILRKFARKLSNSIKIDYEDAFQELSIHTWSSLKNYKSKYKSSHITYLYSCISRKVNHIIYDYKTVKYKNTQPEYLDPERLDVLRSGYNIIERQETKIVLDQLEERLCDKRSIKIFKLLRIGYSLKNIADLFNLSYNRIWDIWRVKILNSI